MDNLLADVNTDIGDCQQPLRGFFMKKVYGVIGPNSDDVTVHKGHLFEKKMDAEIYVSKVLAQKGYSENDRGWTSVVEFTLYEDTPDLLSHEEKLKCISKNKKESRLNEVIRILESMKGDL